MTEEIESHILKKYEILQKLGILKKVKEHMELFGRLLIKKLEKK